MVDFAEPVDLKSTTNVFAIETVDHKFYGFPLKFLSRSKTLSHVYNHMKERKSLSGRPFPLLEITSASIETIIVWCKLHENEPPTTERERFLSRFDKEVRREDVVLFERFKSRAELMDLINATYLLEIHDLTAMLVRYTARNMEGKSLEELSKWMEVGISKEAQNFQEMSPESSGLKRSRPSSN